MYRELSHLLLFSDLNEDEILVRLAEIFCDWETGVQDKDALIGRIYAQIKRLLDLATACGFDENLWQCYLTWLLMTNENSFTRTCERTGAREGSVNHFAKKDFAVFRRLMDFDFAPIEQDLGIDCFSTVCAYQAIPKRERMYNRDISQQVQALRRALAAAQDEDELFGLLTGYYRQYGYGVFAMNRAFRINREEGQPLEFLPICNIDRVMLDDLVGCDYQKQELRRNTEAFLDGKRANNVLLYGDRGTGKSSTVKAILNEYADKGLRMIEVPKEYLHELPDLTDRLSALPMKFIIFIDDLSFAGNDDNFSALKAVLEGGLATRPQNVLVYATSNRRHLLRESFDNRDGNEVHAADTVQESVSLSDRFGITLTYIHPDQRRFVEMIRDMARDMDIPLSDEALYDVAQVLQSKRGARSPRYARQYLIDMKHKLTD
jgi:predicted AAA+ superfamily ATPase